LRLWPHRGSAPTSMRIRTTIRMVASMSYLLLNLAVSMKATKSERN
jgi:hypothetical protein